MNDTLIAQIQSFTLNARAALETETGRQLEGIYGWLPDGTFADPSRYTAVKQILEAADTRRRLETYADEEKAAGIAAKEARIRLVRETAFTWLNRLVALRMMEDRKIIKSTVGKLEKSNSFIFWLTSDGNDEMYALHQKGALPQNAKGEGPSDTAYRNFLLWQCNQLARDVSVLFDPENLSSRLFPRPPILKQIVEAMNQEDLMEAWQIGNEETVGWVYEGFIEEENKAVFEKFGKGKKVRPEEIGAATQRFTPKWIVRFLVENSLGKLWVEMHPDSNLKGKLAYLVPTQRIECPLKPVRTITFLDPSCGSMHFGIMAFDLFFEMYREELDNAGRPGWPENPSISSPDEIPASIIANNLHGIDIDLRAVQLSALTLFLKARTLNKDCAFTDRNIACANVEAITGGRLEKAILQFQFSHPIYERILRTMASRIKDSDQLGSLLRLEKSLEYLISEERKRVESKKQTELPFPGITAGQFSTKEGVEEFFEILFEQLMRHLDGFAQQSRVQGVDHGHFAAEASKGLRYLRLVSSQYDVVATNPPYMSRRNMSPVIAKHLDDNYTHTKGDLYAAFISRCLELAAPAGKVAMVTQQSFMFIKTYEKMRDDLRGMAFPDSMAHLGPKAFPNITGEKVNTTAFVLSKETNTQKRLNYQGTYFRMVRARNSEAKRIAFEDGLDALKAGQHHPLIFTCQQQSFDAIPGKPWVYWMPLKLLQLFCQLDILGNTAPPRQGLATADNNRFLRKWWEVDPADIERGASSCSHSKSTGKKWFPYMKGGTPIPWFGNQEHVLNWKKNGAEIDAFRPRSVIRNPDFYFRKGVTWSDVSSKGFAGRLSPGGFVHDVKGMTCYPPEEKILTVLGLFNSSFANFVLSALNPTISYQVGDIERLPIPDQSSEPLDSMVEKSIDLAMQDSVESEITYGFIQPPVSVAQVADRHSQLRGIEEDIDKEVTRLYGLTEEDCLTLKAELEVKLAVSEDDTDDNASHKSDDDDDATESAWTEFALARAWISYAFGTTLGRYAIGEPNGLGRGNFEEKTVAAIRSLIDEDGIMVSQPGNPQDISVRTLRCLELMRGQDTAQALIREACGSDGDSEDLLRNFLDRFTGTPEVSFWRHHFQLYRKRPIYWPLQSPKRKFTVWVFQERFTTDTLFKVRSEFVDPKTRWLESRIKDLKDKADQTAGAEKRRLEKEASQLADIFDDVQEFSKRLNAIIQKGYTPHIDDGVLLNAAPLWELLPSWTDTKKAGHELEDEKYDWAHQAMEYWPDRVREKCKTNKSFAIAHGIA